MMKKLRLWVQYIWVRYLRELLEKIPLFGTRFFCAGARAHKMAFYEFLFSIVSSTIPLWLGSLLIMAMDANVPDTVDGFKDTFINLLNRGDLFLYCTSILTVIAWLNIKHSINSDSNNTQSTERRNDLEELRGQLNLEGSAEAVSEAKSYRSVYPPNKFLFLSLAILGLIVSAAFYAANLANTIKNPELLRRISTTIYLASLVLYHNVLVSDHSSGFESFEQRTSEHTKQFVEDYAAYRGGNNG